MQATHRLAEFIPLNRFLGSISVYKYGLCIVWGINCHVYPKVRIELGILKLNLLFPCVWKPIYISLVLYCSIVVLISDNPPPHSILYIYCCVKLFSVGDPKGTVPRASKTLFFQFPF
jgi:hypothetical protein